MSFKKRKEGRGKVVVVTGGAVRVGRAICVALAESGFCVGIHYNRSASQAAELAAQLASMGAEARVFQTDLLEPGACERLVRDVSSAWGRLDLWVNSAASFYPDDAPREHLEAMTRLNTEVPKRLGAAVRDLLAQSRGCLVNIADVLGATATSKHGVYAASKRRLIDWTTRFARETAPQGIRVNAVAPGIILPSTKDAHIIARLVEKVPMNRVGNPEDVARAVAYLAGADYVTGQTLFVDGGRHLNPI